MPVKCAFLGAALQAARDELVNVDLGRCAVLGGVVLEVLGYGCGAQSFTGQPADALKSENGVEGIREALVLRGALVR